MERAEILILAGCYGSGKTTLALNLALSRRAEGRAVTAVDLDVINPYFRMTDGAGVLRAAGGDCLFSEFVNTNVDLPQHFPQLRTLLAEPPAGSTVVVDVGGDETGAVALGQYAALLTAAGAKTWLVLNRFRPFVGDPAEARESLREVETAARMPFSGLVANPNLGRETTAGTILSSVPYYEEMSRTLDLPVLFTPVREDLIGEVDGRLPWPVIPIRRFAKPGWDIE